MKDKIIRSYKQSKIILLVILLLGIILRLFFQIGHVYSDDAYYSYLSYTIYSGDFANNYLGYPVFLLRLGQTGLTTFAFLIFGTTETATIIFPFLFSVINIFLTYKLTSLLTGKENISLMAAFLICIFPTDIVFATINFPDAINMFFINLGIYFLLKSYKENKLWLSLVGGLSIFLSMQFKENAYYFGILILILFVHSLIKAKRINIQLLIPLAFLGLNILVEGFVYLLIHQDFLFRISITSSNYKYSYYDFFPYTAQQLSGSKYYLRNLFDQIFFINLRSVFLRRFYLLLPIAGFIQSIINFKKKEYALLTFWFIGLFILLVAFTTSFSEYKPLDLQRSWYIYPLIMPMIILSSILLSKFKRIYLTAFIIVLCTSSIIMSRAYEVYFQKSNLQKLNTLLRANPGKLIATDHFTKYSVDLIRNYSDKSLSIRFEDVGKFQVGSWILFNQKHIDELKLQGCSFQEFNFKNKKYKLVNSIGDFDIYEIKANTGD